MGTFLAHSEKIEVRRVFRSWKDDVARTLSAAQFVVKRYHKMLGVTSLLQVNLFVNLTTALVDIRNMSLRFRHWNIIISQIREERERLEEMVKLQSGFEESGGLVSETCNWGRLVVMLYVSSTILKFLFLAIHDFCANRKTGHDTMLLRLPTENQRMH